MKQGQQTGQKAHGVDRTYRDSVNDDQLINGSGVLDERLALAVGVLEERAVCHQDTYPLHAADDPIINVISASTIRSFTLVHASLHQLTANDVGTTSNPG